MLWPETTTRDARGRLTIGGLALPDLAREFGTPLYVFDEVTLRARAGRARQSLASHYPNSRVVYAGKAYLSPAILRLLHEEGLGLDVVSGGELFGALRAGIPPAMITFHGNNKSERELREAITAGVELIAIDNDLEIDRLAALTAASGPTVNALIRVNPGIDVHTHDKIKTGATDSKFGFPLWTGDAKAAAVRVVETAGLEFAGFHVHLGSQLFDPEAATLAVRRLVALAAELERERGVTTAIICPGGGFGIAYVEGQPEAEFDTWARTTAEALKTAALDHGIGLPRLMVEPGRTIAGPAAVALYEVGSIKVIPGIRTYVSVDGGMADNIRPTLYGAVYTASIANRIEEGERTPVTIAGRFCESGDILISHIELPALEPGDLLAMPAAGAYALPMASNYNATPRPAVVMVNDGEARLIRRRETYDDVFATEVMPV